MTEKQGATAAGTARFAEGHPELAPGHFRATPSGLTVSSLGLGTYLGADDDTVDAGYGASLSVAIDLGCNVIDTAIVYRNQRSERAIGRTLNSLLAEEVVTRDQLVIATKGGYLPHDSAYQGSRSEYIEETLVRPGIIGPGDIAGGGHCLTPRFLRSQLDLSRRNLNCDVVDIYYLHNPEAQLTDVDRPEFLRRIRSAFDYLEQAVAAGDIGMYGIATWSGFRVAPGAPDFLSLPELIAAAVDVAGTGHHFRAVQLPFNLAMPEAHALRNQTVSDRRVSLLEAAQLLGVTVMCSAALMQARLTRDLGDRLRQSLDGGGVSSDAQRALQFARSAPGVATALVGMSNPGHAVDNCSLSSIPALPETQFSALFT